MISIHRHGPAGCRTRPFSGYGQDKPETRSRKRFPWSTGVLPAYPFWSLTIIAMDVAALYGLCAHGGRANLQSAWDRTMRGMKASGEAREIIGVDAAGIGAGGRRTDASPVGTVAPRTIARRRSRLARRAPGRLAAAGTRAAPGPGAGPRSRTEGAYLLWPGDAGPDSVGLQGEPSSRHAGARGRDDARGWISAACRQRQ